MLAYSYKISFKTFGEFKDYDKQAFLDQIELVLKGLGYRNYDIKLEVR